MQRAEVSSRGGGSSALPDVDDAALLAVPVGGGPTTVDLSIGDYRMVATETAGTVYVIGQPAGGAQDVIARLVVVEVIAIGIALLGGGFAGAVLVRRELRPLERVADTAAKVSALPLDRGEVELAERVARRRPAHRGRPGRERVEPDAGQRRGRAGGAPGQRDAVASVHRRRQPRAAHPARRHPRLRGADPAGPARARDRVLDRPDLVADRADDDAGRRPAAARAPGCGTAAGTRRRRPDAAGARRGQRRLRRRDGPPLAARPARRAGRRPRRRATVDPGADQPARERPHAHACGHDGDRRPRPRRRRGAAHRDRRRPGDRPGPAAARVRAVRPGIRGALAAHRQHGAGPRDRRRRRGRPRRHGDGAEPARAHGVRGAAAGGRRAPPAGRRVASRRLRDAAVRPVRRPPPPALAPTGERPAALTADAQVPHRDGTGCAGASAS